MARKEKGDFELEEKALTGELWNDRAAETVEGSCLTCLSEFERAKGRRRTKAMMIRKCCSDESRVGEW